MSVDLDLCYLPAHRIAALVRDRALSPVEVMDNCLARIEAVNPALNCFCFVYPDEAMDAAREAEREAVAGRLRGPLHGVPVAIKDLTPTAGKRTTRGSRLYEHWVPDEDAIVVERLRAAGAIMVGKTTTPEFAFDGFTASPLWGVTRNPWSTDHTPGGSSGGSGAAVASGCVPLAEGTDMGGSVRVPAAYCGVVGLKPSLGRIPMDILPTVFDDISHFGPLARCVADASLFLSVAAGPDDRDISSLPDRPELPMPPPERVAGRRFALSADLGYYAVDEEVLAALERTAAALREAGAEVDAIDLGWCPAINEAWHACWGVYLEVCFVDDLDACRDILDPAVVELIELGRTVDARTYKGFERLRTEQWRRLRPLLARYDALLCPTTARPAPLLGGTDSDYQGLDAAGRFLGLDMTCPFNFVGQCPALSVPVGFTAAGLPIGLQVVGRRYDDAGALAAAAGVEALRRSEDRRPSL